MARFDRTATQPVKPPAAGPWKHGPLPVIGLIGGIGAGKSRVASLLAERGAQVLDADAIAHALLDQRPVRELVVRRFGPAVLSAASGPDEPARIDRSALGAIVFQDPAALRALEAILHPRMRRTFEKAIARAVRRGRATAVVLDAAILLEKGWNSLCDRVIYVDAPRAQRLARLAAQRGWSDEDLAARERAQWSPDEKRARADLVVDNGTDLAALAAAVGAGWERLLASRPALRRRVHRPAVHDGPNPQDQRTTDSPRRLPRRGKPRRGTARGGFRP